MKKLLLKLATPKVAIGVVVTVGIIGIVTGIMIASKKKNVAKEVVEDVEDNTEDATTTTTEEVVEDVEDNTEDATATTEEVVEDVEDNTEDATTTTEEVVEDVEDVEDNTEDATTTEEVVEDVEDNTEDATTDHFISIAPMLLNAIEHDKYKIAIEILHKFDQQKSELSEFDIDVLQNLQETLKVLEETSSEIDEGAKIRFLGERFDMIFDWESENRGKILNNSESRILMFLNYANSIINLNYQQHLHSNVLRNAAVTEDVTEDSAVEDTNSEEDNNTTLRD